MTEWFIEEKERESWVVVVFFWGGWGGADIGKENELYRCVPRRLRLRQPVLWWLRRERERYEARSMCTMASQCLESLARSVSRMSKLEVMCLITVVVVQATGEQQHGYRILCV